MEEIPAEVTRGMIVQALTEDEDMATTSLRAQVLCPLGTTRIKVITTLPELFTIFTVSDLLQYPCRPFDCNHVQCFDGMTFLVMNEQNPIRRCPVCRAPTTLDALRLDCYFREVLSSPMLGQDDKEVNLLSDGSWRPVRDAPVAADMEPAVGHGSVDLSGGDETELTPVLENNHEENGNVDIISDDLLLANRKNVNPGDELFFWFDTDLIVHKKSVREQLLESDDKAEARRMLIGRLVAVRGFKKTYKVVDIAFERRPTDRTFRVRSALETSVIICNTYNSLLRKEMAVTSPRSNTSRSAVTLTSGIRSSRCSIARLVVAARSSWFPSCVTW
jgi:hypothetical protein